MGTKPLRVHIMGVGGAGGSAVAQIAAHQGYRVTGCDLKSDTPYLQKLRNFPQSGIPLRGTKPPKLQIFTGHDPKHLASVDALAVTPAVFFQNQDHPELVEGKKRNIVITWQELMGKYLQRNKFVVSIAGTHGKSTTTAMAGRLLEKAGWDPTVEVGATVPAWHGNVRLGQSRYFVCEADEYFHNFLHYHPRIIILNNIEMDHPEYFQTFANLLTAYSQFVKNLPPRGVLIYNADDPGNQKLVSSLKSPHPKTIPYRLAEFPADLKLGIPGDHNKLNALGVIKLAEVLKIPRPIWKQALAEFTGVGRRIERLGESRGVTVYDDYANHPTAFAATIAAVRELHPAHPIWAVIEPHTFSRLRALLPQLPLALKAADHVIISAVFASREKDPGDFTGADIARAARHPDSRYIPDFDAIALTLKREVRPGEVILVMGSGDSYRLSRQILQTL